MISVQSKGLSRVFSRTRVQKHQFFGAQPDAQDVLNTCFCCMHKEMCCRESWKALEQDRALPLMAHVWERSGEQLTRGNKKACSLHGPSRRRAGVFTVGWNQVTVSGWRCACGHWGVSGLLCSRELLPPSAQAPHIENGGDKNAPLLSAWGAGGQGLREWSSHIPARPSAWTVGSLHIRTTAWVPV